MNEMPSCKKTMIHSYKGGCGKTSTAIGLALYFSAIRNEKILLIEMDNRGPTFTDLFNVSPKSYINQFYTNAPLKDMITPITGLKGVKDGNFAIICAEQKPFTVPRGRKRKDFFMKAAERLRKQLWAVEREFDQIIIDTPPGVDYPVINNFIICDCIVLLTKLDSTVKRTKYVYELLSSFDKDTILVANMVPVNIESITEEEYGWDTVQRIEEWKKFSKGKKVFTIPHETEIVIELFKNSIPDLNGRFLGHIKHLVETMEQSNDKN